MNRRVKRFVKKHIVPTVLWCVTHRRPITAVLCIILPQFHPNVDYTWLARAAEVTW